MNIQIKKEPVYVLTLQASEMGKLWSVLMQASEKQIPNANKFFYQLEDIRPAGGFKEVK